jgi:hypothetical protein
MLLFFEVVAAADEKFCAFQAHGCFKECIVGHFEIS